MSICCSAHPEAHIYEDYHAGDMICSECGLVISERCIDVSAEWRTFKENPDSANCSRVGAVQINFLNEEDLSTVTVTVHPDKCDFNFKNTKSKSEIANSKAYNEIKILADRLNADTSVISRAQHIFSLVNHEPKLFKEKSKSVIIATCLFLACRLEKCPRTFKELSGVSQIPVNRIGGCFKKFSQILNNNKIENLNFKSDDIIVRFCSKLEMPMEIRRLAEKIMVNSIEIAELNGKSFNSLAASAIYMACLITNIRLVRTKKDIADICGSSEATLISTLKIMRKNQQQLIN